MYQTLEKLNPVMISPELAASTARFLSRYGTPALMGPHWGGLLGPVDPEKRFEVLLDACGHGVDPGRFFSSFFRQILEGLKTGQPGPVVFQGQALPQVLVYQILETALPGQALCQVKTPAQLTARTGMQPIDGDALQEVMETYPVRLSAHVMRQAMVSRAVAAQYLPFEDELDPLGHELTFDGHFKQGLMEQMYRNRAIFLLDMRCPVFCRFCFRKHKSLRKEPSPGLTQVARALERVARNPEIREILITGGEPLLNMRNMKAAVEGLLAIGHVKTLRIATRSLAYYPHLFAHHRGRLAAFLKSAHARCRKAGKQLEIGAHLLHPDEVSVQTLEIISDFTASGIPVYVQTPFLMGVNPEGPVLGKLFSLLRMAGAEIYYIFTPCHPIHGTRKYWSPISRSLEAYAWLRANLSDRCLPKLCTATPLGKMEWHTSGWAVEKDRVDPEHIWIRTPYTPDYFRPMMGDQPLPVETRENRGGTLDVKCLIDMGDPALFMGDKGPVSLPGCRAVPAARVLEIQEAFYAKTPPMSGHGTGLDGLVRTHQTRVAWTLEPGQDLDRVCGYLAGEQGITDVVIRVPAKTASSLDRELTLVEEAVAALVGLDQYLWVRLQWAAVQQVPQEFGPSLVARLRALARFDLAKPLRLEFETWWLLPSQIQAPHMGLFWSFRDAGLGVYANTALVSGLNTDPEMAEALALRIREAGMAFHQVYTQGLAVQKVFDPDHPVGPDQVTAIASRIRMNCTGREVPLYVAWHPGGERDFGPDVSGWSAP